MSGACDRCGVAWEAAGARNGSRGVGSTCPDCGQAAAARAWHIAVGDAAQGPYTLEQLRDRYARGALAFDQYVYCEGWADWKLASEADELRGPRAAASVRPPIPRAVPTPTDDIAEDDGLSGRFSLREALASAREMGADPFEGDDASSGHIERSIRRGAARQDAPPQGWGEGPEEAWDLDNMPALQGLLSRGRIAAPAAPTVASASVEQVAARPASRVMQAAYAPPEQRVFTPRLERATELRELASHWLSAFTGALTGPTYARGVEAVTSFTRQQSRRPGLLLVVALTGFCTGVTGLVAWAVGGREDSSATVKTDVSPMRVVELPTPTPTPTPAPRAEVSASAAPPTVPTDPAMPASASRATLPSSAQPSEQAGLPASGAEPPVRQEVSARSIEDSARVGADSFGDRDGQFASGERRFGERMRAERVAAAKEAREKRLKQRLAKHGHTQRISAKIAGVSRTSHKAADIPFADAADDEPTLPARAKKTIGAKGGSSLDDLVEGAIGGSRRHAAEPAHATPSLDDEPSLPATPSREQMLAALTKAKAGVAQCEGSGTVTASIHIKGPVGRAVKVDVDGASGSSRACVESAIRRTAFPKFQQDNFEVRVGLKLQDS